MNGNQKSPDGTEIALEARQHAGERLFSPSVGRNRKPLLEAFTALLPNAERVLEIGSGTGEHGAFLCSSLPSIQWQPSDPDPTSRASIASWADTVPDNRMASPLKIFADHDDWWKDDRLRRPDTIVSINMIHIAPFAAAEGLFKGAAALLPTGGHLFLYGPFKRHNITAESNLRFDADLKRRNPSWGVRDLDTELLPLGETLNLSLTTIHKMPANNHCVVFEKR